MQRHHLIQIAKYLMAGGIVVIVNLSALYFFTDVCHIYYIVSSIFSFCIAFLCSFALQKFWTFRDHSTDGMHTQLVIYLAMQLANLACNTILLYCFVEYAHLWYILAQALASLILAVGTFHISRTYIFASQREDLTAY